MRAFTNLNAKTRGPPLPACRHAGGSAAAANPRGKPLTAGQTGFAGALMRRAGPGEIPGWPVPYLGQRREQPRQISNLKRGHLTMNVVYDDCNNNDPLTPAGLEARRQFEASPQDGQVLFHPKVADGQPAPNCVAFIEEVGRFAVTIMEGRYTVEDGQWFRPQADGAPLPIDNPLERAWQAAKAVRAELKRKLDLNTYVIAVAWFPDMDEDQGEDILDETGGSSVRLFFGQAGLAQRLANLPNESEVQAHLNAGISSARWRP